MNPLSERVRAYESRRAGFQDQYRRGVPISEILKGMLVEVPANGNRKIHLIVLVRDAFCLSLGQAKPIVGWAPEGTGELSDDQLDKVLRPEIESSRTLWDGAMPGPV